MTSANRFVVSFSGHSFLSGTFLSNASNKIALKSWVEMSVGVFLRRTVCSLQFLCVFFDSLGWLRIELELCQVEAWS